ncbi:MAG: hypothetical protein U1E23_05175 [Reyranellaceae bacterium]
MKAITRSTPKAKVAASRPFHGTTMAISARTTWNQFRPLASRMPSVGASALRISSGPRASGALLRRAGGARSQDVRGRGRLLGHQPRIDAALRHQRRVRALLGDRAAVEHQDAIAVDDARQAMRQDQGGAAAHQAVERLLDHRLVLGVDRRQRLVQHQDRRVAQQRPGDRQPLALAARQLDALLADHRGIALRQAFDEVVDVGRARRRHEIVVTGVGAPEPDVVLDRAVEQERVLVDHGDQRADLRERQGAQVVAAQPHAALVGIVEAQQQAHDRRLAAARRPDQAQPLAGGGAEGEAVVHRAARAGIGEADRLELDGRGQWRGERLRCGIGDQRPVVEDAVQALRRRQADHALVQHRPQLAHRPEDLDAEHQDDQQRRQRQGALLDAQRAVDQRRRGAERDRGVGDAAGQRVGRQHPHGALEQVARLDRQLVGARLALAERLEGGEALDRIEELGGERGIGLLAPKRVLDVPLVPQRWREQRHHGEAQHDQRDRQVDRRHHREDQQGRQQRDHELRQELAKIGLELLDPVDQRQGQAARALAADRARPERGDAIVDRAAQALLDPRRRLVRHHRPPVLGGAAQPHDDGDRRRPARHLGERRAGEDAADQPAEQREAGDAEPDREQADGDGGGDAPPHAAGEDEQARFDVHENHSKGIPRIFRHRRSGGGGFWAPAPGFGLLAAEPPSPGKDRQKFRIEKYW